MLFFLLLKYMDFGKNTNMVLKTECPLQFSLKFDDRSGYEIVPTSVLFEFFLIKRP